MATSVVSIRETSGKRRQLDLIGPGLPRVGANWAGKLVVDTNFNPGNPDGVQHVMGPAEAPSSWNGVWRTTQLSGTPCLFSEAGGAALPVVFAMTLWDTLEDMFRMGQLLVVTWLSDSDVRVVRFGRATDWEFKPRGIHDVEWTASFEWTSRGGMQRKVGADDGILAAARSANLATSNAAGYAEAQSIISQNQASPLSASPFTLGQLESLADAPRQFLSQFTRLAQAASVRLRQFTDVIVTARDQPAALAGLVVDSASAFVGAANDFVDRMGRKGPEQLSLDSSVRSLLQATRFYDGAQEQAEVMAAQNARLARVARKRKGQSRPSAGNPAIAGPGDVIKTYLPKDGETMLSIAMHEYGDDFSYELSKANGLPGQTIVPPRGVALILPQRANLVGLRRA